MSARLRVDYFAYVPGVGYGNLCWAGPHCPVRDPRHPLHGAENPTVFGPPPPSDDKLGRFRARGYFASCFPEGDGIAFQPPEGKTDADIVRDVEDCFGWDVVIRRASKKEAARG